MLGSPAYMAPEQARGKPVDKRADSWAFGVLLFEMTSGRRPFNGSTLSDAIASVLTRGVDFSAIPATTPYSVCTTSKAVGVAIMPAGNHTSTGRQLQQSEGDRVFSRHTHQPSKFTSAAILTAAPRCLFHREPDRRATTSASAGAYGSTAYTGLESPDGMHWSAGTLTYW